MTHRAASAWLLAGLLLVPLPAAAQKAKEHTAQTEAKRETHAAPGRQPDLEEVKARIARATIRFRREQGRGGLRVNDALNRAAQYFADYLARTDEFSHTADGKEPWERAARFGYDYSIVAENIAWEYSSAGFTTRDLARRFVEGWKKSPGHRKNMLDPDVDEIGVGVAASKKTGRYYAVQEFGRPKSETITFQIENETGETIHYRLDGKDLTLRPGYTVTHQRSRPPKLIFETGEVGAGAKPHEYHPVKNDRFAVRKGEGGRLVVEEE
jgi:uncharacterized protein YkwD